jgi:hypothetical protein
MGSCGVSRIALRNRISAALRSPFSIYCSAGSPFFPQNSDLASEPYLVPFHQVVKHFESLCWFRNARRGTTLAGRHR